MKDAEFLATRCTGTYLLALVRGHVEPSFTQETGWQWRQTLGLTVGVNSSFMNSEMNTMKGSKSGT